MKRIAALLLMMVFFLSACGKEEQTYTAAAESKNTMVISSAAILFILLPSFYGKQMSFDGSIPYLQVLEKPRTFPFRAFYYSSLPSIFLISSTIRPSSL